MRLDDFLVLDIYYGICFNLNFFLHLPYQSHELLLLIWYGSYLGPYICPSSLNRLECYIGLNIADRSRVHVYQFVKGLGWSTVTVHLPGARSTYLSNIPYLHLWVVASASTWRAWKRRRHILHRAWVCGGFCSDAFLGLLYIGNVGPGLEHVLTTISLISLLGSVD